MVTIKQQQKIWANLPKVFVAVVFAELASSSDRARRAEAHLAGPKCPTGKVQKCPLCTRFYAFCSRFRTISELAEAPPPAHALFLLETAKPRILVW